MVFSDQFTAPQSLLIYEILNTRKALSPLEKQQYERLRKGFAGEKRLAEFLTSVNYNNMIPLYDCLFESDRTEFQIDCLLVTTNTLFLLEVKNYSNDYLLENGKFFNFATKSEIYNPMTQLERTEYLFKNLLNQMRISINVRSYVLFTNPSFMLYGATPRLSMIFPMQINRFLKKTDANAPPLNDNALRLAQTLAERRKSKSTYEQITKYELSELKRGVFYEHCFMKLKRESKQMYVCRHCQHNYSLDDVVLCSIKQFHLLFPKQKITTNNILNWCGGLISKRIIRRVLNENLKIVVNGPHTHYVFD